MITDDYFDVILYDNEKNQIFRNVHRDVTTIDYLDDEIRAIVADIIFGEDEHVKLIGERYKFNISFNPIESLRPIYKELFYHDATAKCSGVFKSMIEKSLSEKLVSHLSKAVPFKFNNKIYVKKLEINHNYRMDEPVKIKFVIVIEDCKKDSNDEILAESEAIDIAKYNGLKKIVTDESILNMLKSDPAIVHDTCEDDNLIDPRLDHFVETDVEY